MNKEKINFYISKSISKIKSLPIFPVIIKTTKMGKLNIENLIINKSLFSPLVSRSFS